MRTFPTGTIQLQTGRATQPTSPSSWGHLLPTPERFERKSICFISEFALKNSYWDSCQVHTKHQQPEICTDLNVTLSFQSSHDGLVLIFINVSSYLKIQFST